MKTNNPASEAEIVAECARADRIVEEAFPTHGTPRSEVFKKGAAAILKYLLVGQPVLCFYDTATVEHDAFYAGVDAGKRIFFHTENK